MQKLKYILATLCLVALTACGGGSDAEPANTPPTAQDVTVNANGASTWSADLTPYLKDANGDAIRAVLVRSEIWGDIVIGSATITDNVASITVTAGTGNATLYYQVNDGKDTQTTIYRLVINDLDGV